MKKNLRGKIREYIQSEEGKVGAKSPLVLGAATGSLLLAHAIISTPQAEAGWCHSQSDCDVYNTGSVTYVCDGPWMTIEGTLTGTCIPQ